MFWFRLALQLGKSVRQCQAEIDSAEFTEWMAYYQLEPFGETVADIRHGIATSLLANINRDEKTKPQPFIPDDFIPWNSENDDRGDDQGDGVLLDDPVAQANLIRAAIFGVPPS